MPPPISQRTVDRFVQLLGLGLTSHEAARATKISERAGDRLQARPDIQQRLRDEAEPSAAASVRSVVRAMIDSANPAERQKGAELMLRFPGAFEPTDDDPSDALPPGTWIMYPSEYRDDVADGRVPPPAPPPDEPDELQHTPYPGHPEAQRE